MLNLFGIKIEVQCQSAQQIRVCDAVVAKET